MLSVNVLHLIYMRIFAAYQLETTSRGCCCLLWEKSSHRLSSHVPSSSETLQLQVDALAGSPVMHEADVS